MSSLASTAFCSQGSIAEVGSGCPPQPFHVRRGSASIHTVPSLSESWRPPYLVGVTVAGRTKITLEVLRFISPSSTGAQAPATVVPPGMRSGPWNSYDKAQLEDAVGVARLFGASCVRVIRPGYATIEVDLKHEKAAGDRESVKSAERSYIERTAPKKKELTDEQLAAKAASRKAKKNRQKAGERAAASEAERAERPRAQLRANIEYVMDGLRSAAARARSQAGSKTRVTLLAASGEGRRISARPQRDVRHGPPGHRGDDRRAGLARKRAGRVWRD